MDLLDSPDSLLYRRLEELRFALPIVLAAAVAVFEIADQVILHEDRTFQDLASDVLVYGVLGPALVWFAVSRLATWIHQRDEAGARLRFLYDVSLRVADAPDLKSLELLAIEIPERILGPVATSLIVQDVPDAPWVVSGTRNLTDEQRAALEARATNELGLYDGCLTLQPSQRYEDAVAAGLADSTVPAPTTAICLPLSNDRPPHAILNIHLAGGEAPAPGTRQLLTSLAAALAVAMDRARLRSRDMRVLEQIEQTAQKRETGAATLERMLADISAAYEAEAGVVFLAGEALESVMPAPVACWPGLEPSLQLTTAAQKALQADDAGVLEETSEIGHITAVPLIAEGRRIGVMALTSLLPYLSSQLTLLRVAAGLMAMVVRNDRLSAALESHAVLEERFRLAREVHDGLAQSFGFLSVKVQLVESLLSRGQLDTAKRVLREARQEIADSNMEIRLTILALRSRARIGQGLAEHLQELIAAFAERSGLAIHFTADGHPDLSPEAETQLIRIVQEALANVHRHAHARQAWVCLQAEPQRVTLEVKDDGAGFPEAALRQRPAGFGLDIIQERVEAVGGRMRLHSTPGQGVVLQVAIPTRRVAEGIRSG